MHPAIAQIVSDCFYGGDLSTADKKKKEYREGVPPLRSADIERLPEKPIVFLDMPYVRSQLGYRGGDRAPPWSNPDEVTAALQILELMHPLPKADGKQPSLAVLSPYREQVKALKGGITTRLSGTLQHLAGFDPAVGNEEYWGTVDSFQGDQADLVLISMVRNNGHANPGKALGFLRDDRRMNVLLSRAKWRMIVIGSLEFYRNIVELSASMPDTDIGFMRRFIDSLERAKSEGEAVIVPWKRLSGGTPP
jgi:hypothetical protein